MGNTASAEIVREEQDIWWTNGQRQQEQNTNIPKQDDINITIDQKDLQSTTNTEREQRKRELEEDFIKFKQELARKHERRRELIAEKRQEMTNLREELIKEKEENERLRCLFVKNNLQKDIESNVLDNNLREENEELKNEIQKLKLFLQEREVVVDKNKELRISLAELQKELQSVNREIIDFEKERMDYQEHVVALKDIIRVTKEMLKVRENQIEELKKKITSIEELLASKEMNILSEDLRHEYERQLRNIRDLRALYEERQRADKREKENLFSQIEDLKKNIEDEQKKNGELQERIDELEEDNSKKYDKIVGLESNLGLSKAECKDLRAEMEIINQLFSQILISFNNDQDIDLDNMIKILEENHDLLTNIVINDESGETSALPKLLLDLVNQVNEHKKDNKETESSIINEQKEEEQQETSNKLDVIHEEEEPQMSGMHQLNSPKEIVENLPKVWRVLIELLSHQSPPNNEITEKKPENDNHCYKSVETPTGLRKVLSVSKTFIRLKSLILEKKGLEKEMTRLKHLNTHLEGRLQDQEKRLVLVSNELTKTWNVVGKMQKQHQQLHTQEKILRYELAQKRKLLTELKEELEYCRQKWSQARKQNSSTEEQWKQLRTEFASRKRCINDDVNNSVESGYSDDKSSSDEEDNEFHNKTCEVKEKEITPEMERIQNIKVKEEKQNIITVEIQESLPETEIPETETTEMQQALSNETTVENEVVEIQQQFSEHQQSVTQLTTPNLCNSHSLQVEKTDLEETNSVKRQNHIFIIGEETTNERLTSVLSVEPNTSKENSTDDPITLGPKNTTFSTISEQFETAENSKEDMQKANDRIGTSELSPSFSERLQSSESSSQKPSTSTSHKNPAEAAEEFVARREERMKRLEEQCSQLFFSVAKTSIRGMVMSNKLDNLHEIYGDNSEPASDRDGVSSEVDTQETQESHDKGDDIVDSNDNSKSTQE